MHRFLHMPAVAKVTRNRRLDDLRTLDGEEGPALKVHMHGVGVWRAGLQVLAPDICELHALLTLEEEVRHALARRAQSGFSHWVVACRESGESNYIERVHCLKTLCKILVEEVTRGRFRCVTTQRTIPSDTGRVIYCISSGHGDGAPP